MGEGGDPRGQNLSGHEPLHPGEEATAAGLFEFPLLPEGTEGFDTSAEGGVACATAEVASQSLPGEGGIQAGGVEKETGEGDDESR